MAVWPSGTSSQLSSGAFLAKVWPVNVVGSGSVCVDRDTIPVFDARVAILPDCCLCRLLCGSQIEGFRVVLADFAMKSVSYECSRKEFC